MGLYENVRDIAKTKGYSVNKLEQELGFARSSINKFNKNTPSAEKLQQIADLLGVTVDYLMTGKETVGSCEYDISNLKKHTENEQALLENFSKLNFKGEEEAIKRVRELVFVPEYTENQEELWQLIPGSCKTVEKPADWDKQFEDDDSSNIVTYTSHSTIPLSEVADTVEAYSTLAAARNDHMDEEGEMEKTLSDIEKLRKLQK